MKERYRDGHNVNGTSTSVAGSPYTVVGRARRSLVLPSPTVEIH
jgi:hypothetical protein